MPVEFRQADFERTASTIDRLRSMRGTIHTKLWSGQPVLEDAEQLVATAAQALVSRIQRPKGFQHSREWNTALELMAAKYPGPPFSIYHTDSANEASGIIKTHLIPVSQNWRRGVAEILSRNHVYSLSPQDFLDHQLGIYSPLSTDYLLISTYQQYLRTFVSKSTFQLKPAYIGWKSEDFPNVMLASDVGGNIPFQDCNRLSSLVNLGILGNSRGLVLGAIESIHPGKKVVRY